MHQCNARRKLNELRFLRLEGLMMKMRTLKGAALALAMLLTASQVNAASTYTINLDVDLLADGSLGVTSGGMEYESTNIPISLPALYIGDAMNITINFTKGLALTVYDLGGPLWDRQLFNGIISGDRSQNGIIYSAFQLSLLHASGDILTPDVVGGLSECSTCAGWGKIENFTDTSFSFRGLSVRTSIVGMLNVSPPVLLAPDEIHFQVWGANIEITHGASQNPAVPEPSTWALMLLGFAGLGWGRSRRKVAFANQQ
jgi:hypothetical protein